MIITLTQQPAELAIGATARLRVDLGISAPPMDSAALVGVAAGAWTKISLGSGLSLDGTTLSVLGGGGSGGPLPLASTSLHGVVRIGANISVDGGLISLTKANAEAALGLVPVDAKAAAAAAPVQSVAGRTGAVTLGAADISGLSKVATSGAFADLSGTPSPYTLPAATTKALGGVIAGAGLAIDGGGTLSIVESYGMTVDFSQGAAPVAGTITLDGRLAGPVTILAADHSVGTAGGTIDCLVRIVSGGTPTPIGGLDAISSSSSSVTTVTATSANKGAAGDRLELVISKVSGTPAGAHITIRGTRP